MILLLSLRSLSWKRSMMYKTKKSTLTLTLVFFVCTFRDKEIAWHETWLSSITKEMLMPPTETASL